ncbi:unnamed protein product [Closterium sp. Naga37s-1]|nr:unnamed protein product [Closterium sp. Naga37s-1]
MNGTGITGAGSQRKSTGNEMSEKLLQGWAMLAMHCPVCFNPILRSRAGEKRCVVCDLPVIEEADAPPQMTSAAPQEPAQQQQGGRSEDGAAGWEKEAEERGRDPREGGMERVVEDGLVSGTPLERMTGAQQRQDLPPIGPVLAATPSTAAAAAATANATPSAAPSTAPSAAGGTANGPIAPLLPSPSALPASLPVPGMLPLLPGVPSSLPDTSMSALNAAANDALIGALRAAVTQLQPCHVALLPSGDLRAHHRPFSSFSFSLFSTLFTPFHSLPTNKKLRLLPSNHIRPLLPVPASPYSLSLH